MKWQKVFGQVFCSCCFVSVLFSGAYLMIGSLGSWFWSSLEFDILNYGYHGHWSRVFVMTCSWFHSVCVQELFPPSQLRVKRVGCCCLLHVTSFWNIPLRTSDCSLLLSLFTCCHTALVCSDRKKWLHRLIMMRMMRLMRLGRMTLMHCLTMNSIWRLV